MKCPYCSNENTSVKDSRTNREGNSIRRRRYCTKCKMRFSTFELPQLRELFVIKRSGSKRPLEKKKIHDSILMAIRKRALDESKIDKIVTKICLELESEDVNEIPTRKIGELIMRELAKIDEVAYIRFASVYKDFTSVQDFSRFINEIRNKI